MGSTADGTGSSGPALGFVISKDVAFGLFGVCVEGVVIRQVTDLVGEGKGANAKVVDVLFHWKDENHGAVGLHGLGGVGGEPARDVAQHQVRVGFPDSGGYFGACDPGGDAVEVELRPNAGG